MQEKARRGELTREQYKQLIEALKLRRQVEALTIDGGIPPEDVKSAAPGIHSGREWQVGGFR